MTTSNTPIYASQARPWLKFYDQKYIDQTMPACTAFELVCRQNKNRLGETARNTMAASSPTLILSSTSKRRQQPCGPRA